MAEFRLTRKQKKRLLRILIAVLLLILSFIFSSGLPFWGLCLAAYLVVGADVLRKSVLGVLHGELLDENFLMTIATLGALLLGDLREAVSVMLLYQVGELFQDAAVDRSRDAIRHLVKLRPDLIHLERNGEWIDTDPSEGVAGDRFRVFPGEKVPLDAIVLEGSSVLDKKALTGEALPESVEKGQMVLSGSINLSETLVLRAEKSFAQSTVSRILELVEEASDKKSQAEQWITRFARVYTPAVVAAAVLLAVIPTLISGGAQARLWISRALVFLVISCPCALVISVPLSFFGGIGGASKEGILVKGSTYLEQLAKVSTVVFDKTGTLTTGHFQVTCVNTESGISEKELLETAALAEQNLSHPLALSIRESCIPAPDPSRAERAENLAGLGVKAWIDGSEVLCGSARLMKENGIIVSEAVQQETVLYIARKDANGSALLGSIALSDTLRLQAERTIQDLRKMKIRTVMLTGDRSQTAAAIAGRLDIDEYHASLLPADKVSEMERLLALQAQQDPGGKIVFVGDGINDAPVLMRADIGAAMGAIGSDAAIEAADLVLMQDDPSRLVRAIEIGRFTMKLVRENIIFAIGVKLLILILSAFGLAGMELGVFADVGVAVIAILNAMRALHIPKKAEKDR